MKTSTKKMGRPPSENPKCETVRVRLTKEQKQELIALCERKHMTMSELILKGIQKMK